MQTEEPTRVLARAHRRALAAGRELEGARGAPADARGRLPRARRRRSRGVTLFAHQFRADQLIFWRSRESAIFIFLFPVRAVPPARLGVRRHDTRASRPSTACWRADRIRRREHGLRRPGDHARRPARERDPQTAARDAAADAVYLRAVLLSTLRRLRAPVGDDPALGRLVFDAHASRPTGSRSRSPSCSAPPLRRHRASARRR